ncbi:hypothetical protein N0V90_012067 [Kalmusia sp. IMI 367209]|nr:hypothetical protein N0V90_012067 [Kalmusia sp. IMI 367209]
MSLKLNNIILGVISAACVLLRVVFKAVYSAAELGWDDYMILATLICGIPSTIAQDIGTIGHGLGKDVWTLSFATITTFVKWFYIMEVLYFFNVAMLKLSLLLFFMRIFPARPVKRLLWATIGFDILFGLAFIFAAIFQCQPISHYWDKWDGEHLDGKCVNINALGWANAVISIAIDIWMLALPLWQVSQLKLAWKKKVSVALMFFVGTFMGPIDPAFSEVGIKQVRSGSRVGREDPYAPKNVNAITYTTTFEVRHGDNDEEQLVPMDDLSAKGQRVRSSGSSEASAGPSNSRQDHDSVANSSRSANESATDDSITEEQEEDETPPAEVTMIDPEGDLRLVVTSTDGTKSTCFPVSSKCISFASAKWADAIDKADGQLKLVDNRLGLIRLTIGLTHLKRTHASVRRNITFMELIERANFCNDHGLLNLFHPFARDWAFPWMSKLCEPGYEQWIMVAYHFGFYEIFAMLSEHLAQKIRLDDENKWSTESYATCLNPDHASMCTEKALGSLLKGLRSRRIWPERPMIDSIHESVDELRGRLSGIRVRGYYGEDDTCLQSDAELVGRLWISGRNVKIVARDSNVRAYFASLKGSILKNAPSAWDYEVVQRGYFYESELSFPCSNLYPGFLDHNEGAFGDREDEGDNDNYAEVPDDEQVEELCQVESVLDEDFLPEGEPMEPEEEWYDSSNEDDMTD